MADHRKWAESQLSTLLSLGLDLIEAQRSVKWVLDNLPLGADPATWIPDASLLDTPLDATDVMDARADWYAKRETAPEWKRLLDAR